MTENDIMAFIDVLSMGSCRVIKPNKNIDVSHKIII